MSNNARIDGAADLEVVGKICVPIRTWLETGGTTGHGKLGGRWWLQWYCAQQTTVGSPETLLCPEVSVLADCVRAVSDCTAGTGMPAVLHLGEEEPVGRVVTYK